MNTRTIFHLLLSIFLFTGIMLGAYLAPMVYAQEDVELVQENELNDDEELEEETEALEVRQMVGQIQTISDLELTLRVDGQERFFMIAEDADIVREGENVHRAELRVGDQVEIIVIDENTVTEVVVVMLAEDEPVLVDEETDRNVVIIVLAILTGLLAGWGLMVWRRNRQ